MGFGRGCFIIFFPMLFTVATIVLAIVTFLGCYEHAWGLRNIYYLKLDFTNIHPDLLPSGVAFEPIYQIGSDGYCYGAKNAQGSVALTQCLTPMTPFWFDVVSFAEDQSTAIATVLQRIKLPSEITDYESIMKSASIAMWSLWIATMGLSFIQLFVGLFAFRSRGFSCFSAFLSVLSLLTSIVAAGIATGMYTIYRNKINDYLSISGISASIGSSGLALAWVTVAVCLIAGISWILSICVGSTRHKHQKLPDHDEKSFIGYVPNH